MNHQHKSAFRLCWEDALAVMPDSASCRSVALCNVCIERHAGHQDEMLCAVGCAALNVWLRSGVLGAKPQARSQLLASPTATPPHLTSIPGRHTRAHDMPSSQPGTEGNKLSGTKPGAAQGTCTGSALDPARQSRHAAESERATVRPPVSRIRSTSKQQRRHMHTVRRVGRQTGNA